MSDTMDDIKGIPQSGEWHKKGGMVRFAAAYATLRIHGMAHGDAIEFLTDLYSIVAEEYGD